MFISNITIIILGLHFTMEDNCLAEGNELIVDSKTLNILIKKDN